jgi:hypothetical protein
VTDDAETPTPAPYPLPVGREPVLIHEGPLELRHQEVVIEGEGRLELELVPSLRFRFVLPNAPVAMDVTGNGTLLVAGSSVPVFVTNTVLGRGTVRGSLDGSSIGESSEIAEARFLVANLPEFLGDPLHETQVLEGGGSQRSFWRGRLALAARDWRVTLDERPDYREVHGRLKAEGGFEITHIGSLRRADGKAFADTDATEMLNALGGFLGLVCGAWAPPVAAIGLDGEGNVIWRELRSRWTSPWISRLSAFDTHKHDLSSAFAGYVDRWEDPLWNEPLRIATQMYVEANGPITADTSLLVAQALLELVAWVRFVEELQTRAPADFDNPRAKASQRLRELLGWLGISPTVPASLAALVQEAAQRRWTDGPHAITEMRNSLVHPRRRQRLMATPCRLESSCKSSRSGTPNSRCFASSTTRGAMRTVSEQGRRASSRMFPGTSRLIRVISTAEIHGDARGELVIPAPFLFAPAAVAGTLVELPALRAALIDPGREGEPSEAFAGMRKTRRQIYRALVYHEEIPALRELLERVDHWLARGFVATKLRGADRAQYRSALAELEVADHFDARDLSVTPAEPGAAGGAVADMVVNANGLRAVVEVHSPPEWQGLNALREEAWDTLRNVDLPYAFHFDINVKQSQPIGERGSVPLHPDVLSAALALAAERIRLLQPLFTELFDRLASGDPEAVGRVDAETLNLVVTAELSNVEPVAEFAPRSGAWSINGLGGYRPEVMFDALLERVARKARRRQASSEGALEVLVVDMSRSELEAELTSEAYYQPRFADSLRRFADRWGAPSDILALVQSQGWRQELTTYFLWSRDEAAQAAEYLFGPLRPV